MGNIPMVVNVFLLRNHITRFDEAIDDEARAATTEIAGAAALDFQCRFYLGAENQHRPTWFAFVAPGLVRPLPNRIQSGVSGVVVLMASNRFFAITFGRGRHLLAPGSYEEDFGLKVALNRIAENDLKSIDTKTYDEIVTSARIQTSRDAGLESFGVDVARDLLRAVQGKPRDPTFGTKLAGSDAVTLSRPDLDFTGLADLCDELLVAYGETTYQHRFGWVDNVRQVRDRATLRLLEDALVVALRTRHLGNMHLTLPEQENSMEIDAYRFTRSGRSVDFPSLELGAYLQHSIGAHLPDLVIEDLRNHRIKIRYAGSEDFELRSSILQSLVWETSISGNVYTLFDGRWFKVDSSYSAQVQQYWQSVLRTPYALPEAVHGESEGTYNTRVAAADSRLALFDCRPIRPANAQSPVELCDLLSEHGHFIHVKRRYASATFSHLFAQGSVSAEAFMRDAAFRTLALNEVNTLGKNGHVALFPQGRPSANDYEVVFAVIAPATAAPHLLPFFSAVNFRQHGQRLETLGMRVSLQHVHVI